MRFQVRGLKIRRQPSHIQAAEIRDFTLVRQVFLKKYAKRRKSAEHFSENSVYYSEQKIFE